MKTILRKSWALLALVAFLVGCASTNWETTAGKTLATTAQTVDAAMKGWAMYVVTSEPPVAQQENVKLAYTQYQLAFNIALNSYNQSVILKDSSIFFKANAALAASASDLQALIQSFQPVKATPPSKP